MPSTTTRGYPYPTSIENASDGAIAIQNLASWEDSMFSSGPFSSRPSYGRNGRRYLATDTGDLWLDTGTAWTFLHSTARVVLAVGAATATTTTGGVVLALNAALSEMSVTGAFTRAALGSGHVIRPTFAGLYRVTTTVSGVGGYETISIAGSTVATLSPTYGNRAQTGSLIRRFGSGEDITVTSLLTSAVGGDSVTVEGLCVERVAP